VGGQRRGKVAGRRAHVDNRILPGLMRTLLYERSVANFPALTLHRRCWALLRRVLDVFRPVVRGLAPAFPLLEYQLPCVAVFVLATDSEARTEMILPAFEYLDGAVPDRQEGSRLLSRRLELPFKCPDCGRDDCDGTEH
jgi:hypothetical protein